PDSLALAGAVPDSGASAVGPTAGARPAAAGAVAAAPRATAAPRLPVQDACRSTTNADQRRCLMGLIYRSDVSLQRTYDALIRGLRQRAGGVAEPPAVRALRAEQRAWVDARDRACAREAPLSQPRWGVVRARCFAGFSSRRAALLAARLRGRMPQAP
ncbi:MAG TPA: lysozyme inhibitor LprI family protein, partial [Gemmatirosa sp.]